MGSLGSIHVLISWCLLDYEISIPDSQPWLTQCAKWKRFNPLGGVNGVRVGPRIRYWRFLNQSRKCILMVALQNNLGVTNPSSILWGPWGSFRLKTLGLDWRSWNILTTNGLAWNFVQMFMVFRGYSLISLPILWIFIWLHHQVNISMCPILCFINQIWWHS